MPLETLIAFGLSEKQAATYLALLKSGPTSATNLARLTRINRSTTYVVLVDLQKQGLAQCEVIVNRMNLVELQLYTATRPDVLLDRVNQKVRHAMDLQARIESILPSLRAQSWTCQRAPKVQVFDPERDRKDQAYLPRKADASFSVSQANAGQPVESRPAVVFHHDRIEFYSKHGYSLIIEHHELTDTLRRASSGIRSNFSKLRKAG